MLQTGIFTIKPAVYAKFVALRWCRRYAWMVAIPLIIMLAIGTFSWPWLVVALALICLIAPPIVMLAWFAIASKPDAVEDMREHYVLLEPNSLTLQYVEQSSDISPEHESASCKSVVLPYQMIDTVEVSDKQISILFRSKMPRQTVIIPLDAFLCSTDYAKALALLESRGI